VIVMTFQNGDFETGDLTGWTDNSSGAGSASVTTGAKYSGTYGCSLLMSSNSEGTMDGQASISQDFDTNFISISMKHKVAQFDESPGMVGFRVYVSVHDASHAVTNLWIYGGWIWSTSDWETMSFTKAEIEAMFPSGYHWNESGVSTLMINQFVLA
jgi:hypothetical protein